MKKLSIIFILLISSTMILGQSKMIALDQSPDYNPITVHSISDHISDILWEETFNSTTPPADWIIVDNDGSGAAWDFRQLVSFTSGDSVHPQAGQSFWFSNFNNANVNGLIDEWIISPQLPMVNSGDSLYFWAGAIDGGYDDSLKVWVSTTDTSLGSFTQIGYFKVDGPTGSWHEYGFDLSAFAGNQVYVAVNYYIVDGGPSGNYSDNVWVDHFIITGTNGGTTPISTATEDLNNDFIPDHLGDTFTVQGTVISPNFQTSNISYFIDDGTGGVDLFHAGATTPVLNLGDNVMVTGVISQYNGLTEIIPANESDIQVVSTGNPVPAPMVVTISQYLSNAEVYENRLVGFMNVTKTSGTWPAAGSGGTIYLSDGGSDSLKVYIDSDTDIDGNPEPGWPRDIIGIGSQYTTATPPNDGYEVTPRYYDTDFLPPGSLPVELTSFTANANLNSVVLNWNTASEINNHGFEIQRNIGNGFATVAFVQGHGTTTQPQSYSYADQNVEPGHYTYRLKQMDFQGTSSFSSEVSVDVFPVTYSLEQNYPNPFNPTTLINFNLRVDSKVSLNVFNVLGQKVAQVVNGSLTAGNHQYNFDASRLSSGIYLYRLDATGIDGSTFSAVKKMMLTK
jgi:hypothetical protein